MELLWWHLPVDMLMVFAQTSQAMRDRIRSHAIRRFKASVSPFVDKPHDFRDKLRGCSAAIGGSVALEMAMPISWVPMGLDIYVPSESYEMETYLVEHEGYGVDYSTRPLGPANWELVMGSSSVLEDHYAMQVATVLRPVDDQGHIKAGPTITVIRSADRSALTPIFSSNATSVMNWITADSINVGYPRMTLSNSGVEVKPQFGEWSGGAAFIATYQSRGFRLFQKVSELDGGRPCGAFCVSRFRSTTDEWTLRLAFTTVEDTVLSRHWVLRGLYGAEETCKNRLCDNFGLKYCTSLVSFFHFY